MRVAKIAAIVAIVGIIASILVIRRPALTTLRIAAKALVSPSEGVSWYSFQTPTRTRLDGRLTQNPDDWKLLLLKAERLRRGDSQKETTAEGIERPRVADFEVLVAAKPNGVVGRAAYVRWLFEQGWRFVHPCHAKELASLPPGGGWLPIEEPHPAREAGLVDAAESQLGRLTALDPNNAAWPFMRAYCRFAHLDDSSGLQLIKDAGGKTRFSLRWKEELDAAVDGFSTLGIPRLEARLRLEAESTVGSLSRLIDLTKIAAYLADEMEKEGRLKEAAEVRMAVVDVGRLMWRTGDDIMEGLIGLAVESMGYGDRGIKLSVSPTATEEERHRAKADRDRGVEEAFTQFVRSAGMGHVAAHYAHGLEEGAAYRDAVGAYLESPQEEALRRFRHVGMAYALAPPAWITLGLTAVALGLATALRALVRRKSAAPSKRTLVGVSLAGGLVCLGLLAASAIVAALNPYGSGPLEGLTGAWAEMYGMGPDDSGRIEGFPPAALYPGIGLAVFVAVWALVLIRKAPRSRLWGAAFAAACPVLTTAFWAHAWLAWSAAWPIDATAIVAHSALGVVCIAGIALVWWAWGRKVYQGARAWVPLLATILMVGLFLVLFFPISEMNRVMLWLLLLSVPIVVGLAAIVPRLVSIARLPADERPSYLGILRPGLAVCLAWIFALQLASLIWLGAWRAKAAAEIERAYATSENQAVLRIMEEAQKGQ